MMKLNYKFQNSSVKINKNKQSDNNIKIDVFGKELRLLAEVKQLPDLVLMLGYIIRIYGTGTQGIFRISGNKIRMDYLRTSYSQSQRLEVGISDIHNITGLFKSFLREIPGGAIPCPQSLDLIKATRLHKKSQNLDLLINELIKLPVPHYNLLKFTCSLLNHVSLCNTLNLMNADNLGTVFGPTFFSSVEDLSLLSLANSAATILINNYNDLFKVSAPVHTNLKQKTGNYAYFDDVSGDCGNGSMTKTFVENILTIQFGESYLIFNSNGETNNSMSSFSNDDEELVKLSKQSDEVDTCNSFSANSQFSNSLDSALRICITNHLFSQFQENESENTDSLCTPRLISDTMLISHNNQDAENDNKIKSNPSNVSIEMSRSRLIQKKKSTDDPIILPRREVTSNILQSYLTNHNFEQKGSETNIKSNFAPVSSDIIRNKDLNVEKQSHCVPQLDLSILYDLSAPDNTDSLTELKNQEMVKNESKNQFDKSHIVNIEPKTSDIDTPLKILQRKITNLKRQLRQFEEKYYSINGVRPDKLLRTNNEWYSEAIIELKLLRQEKEQLFKSNNKTFDYKSESRKKIKNKIIDASGDAIDYKSNSSNMSVISRPVSALSEVTLGTIPYNESGRSNTASSGTVTIIKPDDLSQEELDKLKVALEKISNQLLLERLHDNRPNDLELMTEEQMETEKVSMQKALLNFESKYGRKKSSNAVHLMRPLYDRYRQIKKLLSQIKETKNNELKVTQNTLGSSFKKDVCQSAWTSDLPSSSKIQSLNRNREVEAKDRVIKIPTISQLESSNENISQDLKHLEIKDSSVNKFTKINQFQRKNIRTIQYRRTSDPIHNYTNNNKRKTSENEDRRSELEQLKIEKKNLQNILKDFENNFYRETKRKLEKSDKLSMEREYNRYKTVKNRIKELEEFFESYLS